jgi:tetratricopeptide (TPR) repeat protein
MGRLEETRTEAEKTLQIDPNSLQALYLLGRVYLLKKEFAEGIQYFEFLAKQTGRPTLWLAYAYSVSGRKAESQRAFNRSNQMSERSMPELGVLMMVLYHTGMGNRDEAFQLSERMYQEEGALQNLKTWPEFAPLRSDPRYAVLMKKIGLPSY